MGTLLRVVMYVVAVVAGVDTYVVGPKFLVDQFGLSAGAAQITAALVGAVLALFLATIPIAIYQRIMRKVVARRRARRLARGEPVDDLPEDEAPRRKGPEYAYGVISRENRALRWPEPEPAAEAPHTEPDVEPDAVSTAEDQTDDRPRATQSWPGDGT